VAARLAAAKPAAGQLVCSQAVWPMVRESRAWQQMRGSGVGQGRPRAQYSAGGETGRRPKARVGRGTARVRDTIRAQRHSWEGGRLGLPRRAVHQPRARPASECLRLQSLPEAGRAARRHSAGPGKQRESQGWEKGEQPGGARAAGPAGHWEAGQSGAKGGQEDCTGRRARGQRLPQKSLQGIASCQNVIQTRAGVVQASSQHCSQCSRRARRQV
jgi:hypothetical protein